MLPKRPSQDDEMRDDKVSSSENTPLLAENRNSPPKSTRSIEDDSFEFDWTDIESQTENDQKNDEKSNLPDEKTTRKSPPIFDRYSLVPIVRTMRQWERNENEDRHTHFEEDHVIRLLAKSLNSIHDLFVIV